MHYPRLRNRIVRFAAVALALGFLASVVSAQTTWYVDDDACPGPGSGTIGDPFCSIQFAIDNGIVAVGADWDDDNGSSSGSAYLFDVATGLQIAKLLPSDGAMNNRFGYYIAIDSGVVAVGAYGAGDNGSYSGSAYLFTVPTVPPSIVCPDEFYGDSDAQDQFGFSVAIDGGTAIVGALGDDDDGNFSGAAFLYDTTSGTQIAKLHASNGAIDKSFGFSVGISGSTAIVGMDLDETTPIAQSAYLFDATTGLQTHELLANDGLPYDWFGFDVAIDGTTALVGAFGDDDNGESSGSAYLFNANTGIQTFKLLPASGATWDAFGFSVALSGNTVIVGSPFDDDAGQDAGAAYIFDASTGLQLAKLLAPDGAAGDNFGFSVGLDGLTAVIGSPGDGDGWSDSGSAYIFDVVTEAQLHKLHASNGGVDRSFGFSVDISGFRVIVGMDLDETTPVLQSAYLFDATTGVEIQELQACDGSPYDWYGFSVAIDRGKAIVGAFGVGDDAGAAYIHEYEFCAADIDGDGVVNVTDLLALLAAWGPCPVPPLPCPSDFNNDGNVNVFDLLAMLAAWGECP